MPIILDTHNGSRYERINISYAAGDPKGDASDPYNWDDLVAFTAGETYKVYKVGDSSYFSEYAIYIVGANTVFEHNDCEVTWLDSDYANTYCLRAYTGIFKSQNSNYICKKTATTGFNVENINSVVKNLQIKGFFYADVRSDNSLLFYDKVDIPVVRNYSYEDLIIKYTNSGVYIVTNPIKFENNTITDSLTGIFFNNNGGAVYSLIKKVNLINVTTHLNIRLNANVPSSTHYIQDSNIDLDSYSIKYKSKQSTSNMTINLTSTFIVKSIGGTAQLYDKNNNLIETVTLINGDTEFTPVKYKSRYLACEGTTLTDNILTDYEPFKLVINKDGYKEYVEDNIYVTDENGIGTLMPVEIRAKLEQLTPEITGILITDCTNAGSNDGSIEITVDSYYDVEYSIDGVNYQQSNIFSNLSEGVYTVYVKDENGAIDSLLGVKITKPAEILPQIAGITIENASAIGESDGSITITAMAYNTPVEYSLGGTFQSSNVFTGLAAGTYAVTVRDSRGNIDSVAGLKIIEPEELLPRITRIVVTGTTSNTGIITVTAESDFNLEYSLNGITYQQSNEFTNLNPGEYIVYVKSSTGKITTLEGVTVVSIEKDVYYNGIITARLKTNRIIAIIK